MSSIFEIQLETSNFDPLPVEIIDLKIASVNELRCLMKGVKVHICITLGVGRAMGVKYTRLRAFLPALFSTSTCRTTRQVAVPSIPKHVLSCKVASLGGRVNT